MSLLPAYFSSRKRDDEPTPPSAPEPMSASDSRDDIFNLIPPRPEEPEVPAGAAGPAAQTQAASDSSAGSRNVHPVGAMDLSRLSIDNDGRLYWDGKPVEVRRRIMMSREQIIGACIVGGFIIVGAISSIIQGAVATHEFACRIGWATCASHDKPSAPATPVRPDIPA